MFIFSILPTPLSVDSDGNAQNNNISPLASAQQRVKELESFLASLLLNQAYDFDPNTPGDQPPPGIDTTDINEVANQLAAARFQEITLRNSQGGETDMRDQTSRLGEVNSKISSTDQRISDLNSLLEALMRGGEMPSPISGVDNSDANAVRQELERATRYRNVLVTSRNYWEGTVNSHSPEPNTGIGDISRDQMFYGYDDQFGMVGITRITQLQRLLKSLILNQPFDADPTRPGNQPLTGVDNTDANAIRQQIATARAYFMQHLPKSKDEPWFKELRITLGQRHRQVHSEKIKVKERVRDLQKLLRSLTTGRGRGRPVSGVDNSDPNAVRMELMRTQASLTELQAEYEFLGQAKRVD